ncbi:MAG TPA: N-acetylmuramoyl-L-alanine amidase [Rhizomicrobium sp.]|nr:N-acetylmuramoyl-L-alanine amidase [Rhizomicrobium sp.]
MMARIVDRIVERRSPNHDARPDGMKIDMLVLHYTGMKTAEEALARLCDPEARVSAHYTIDTDGRVYRHVPEELRAWHAGISYWAGERNINGCSVGIEIVNPGHEFGYVPFAKPQIAALIDLGSEILARHRIPPARVVGHSDVAPARKEDPGELFPWAQLADFGLGLWPFAPKHPAVSSSRERNLPPQFAWSAKQAEAVEIAQLDADLEQSFIRDLRAFGYGVPPEADVPLEKVVAAFQRHWRPEKIDGRIDEECAYRLGALLDALS